MTYKLQLSEKIDKEELELTFHAKRFMRLLKFHAFAEVHHNYMCQQFKIEYVQRIWACAFAKGWVYRYKGAIKLTKKGMAIC